MSSTVMKTTIMTDAKKIASTRIESSMLADRPLALVAGSRCRPHKSVE